MGQSSSSSSQAPSAPLPSWSDSVKYKPSPDIGLPSFFDISKNFIPPSQYKDPGISWADALNYKPSGRMAGDVLRYGQDNSGFKYPYDGQPDRMSAINGSVQKQGDLTFVYPQTYQPFTVAGQQGLFSQIAGVAAPFASLIPGVGPAISMGLGAASKIL
jgi:hypothetical protein